MPLAVPPSSFTTPYIASVIFSTVGSEKRKSFFAYVRASSAKCGCLKTPPMAIPADHPGPVAVESS